MSAARPKTKKQKTTPGGTGGSGSAGGGGCHYVPLRVLEQVAARNDPELALDCLKDLYGRLEESNPESAAAAIETAARRTGGATALLLFGGSGGSSSGSGASSSSSSSSGSSGALFSSSSSDGNSENNDGVVVDDDDNAPLRRRSSGRTRAAAENLTATQLERLEGILAFEKEETKKIFETERNEILASLPMSYKGMFGQIGFAKFGKIVYGLLVLNPYDVPPGTARFEWLDTYQKVRRRPACFTTEKGSVMYVSTGSDPQFVVFFVFFFVFFFFRSGFFFACGCPAAQGPGPAELHDVSDILVRHDGSGLLLRLHQPEGVRTV